MTAQNLQFVLDAILIAIGLYLAFFKSYFQEKGKNLATKEDIGEITQKVKTIESSINIITGNVVDYNALKRNHILEYFASYNNWQRTISNSEIDYSRDCKEINNIRFQKILDAKHLYNLREGEIELFIREDEFYNLRTPLTIETLKYQQSSEILADDLTRIHLENLPNNFDLISSKLTKFREETIEFTKSTQQLRNDLLKYLENQLKKMME